MSNWKRIFILLLCLGSILIIHFIPIANADVTYHEVNTNGSANQVFSQNIPYEGVRPYPVRVWYEIAIGSLGAYYQCAGPSVTITNCSPTVTGSYNNTISGYITIPANQQAQLYVNSGHAWTFLNDQHWGSIIHVKLRYQLDTTPPDMPANFRIKDDSAKGSKYIDAVSAVHINYTDPIPLIWDNSTDYGTTYFQGYPSGPSPITFILKLSDIGHPDVIQELTTGTNPHETYTRSIPSTGARPYPVSVWYQIEMGNFGSYWSINANPSVTITGCSPSISGVYNNTITGYFTIPANQQAQLNVDTGDAMNFSLFGSLRHWGVPIHVKLIYSYGFSVLITGNEYNIPRGEGVYDLSVVAKDYDGNQSPPNYLKLIVDRSTKPVTLTDEPIQFIGRNNANFIWNMITDDLSTPVRYQTALTNDNQAPLNYEQLVDTTLAKFTALSSQRIYYAWVRGVDQLGNLSAGWSSTGPFSPAPEPAGFTDVSPKSLDDNGKPKYEVELKMSDADAASYVIEREVEGNPSARIQLAEKTYAEMVQNQFKYIDSYNLDKRGQYRYSVYTKNALGVKSDENSVLVLIKNIEAGNAITGPADNYMTKDLTQTFDINPKVDIEGDNLRFRVIYKLGDKEYGTNDPFVTNTESVTFPSDGDWKWWLEVQEYSDSEIVATQTTENRVISIDTTPPNGSLTIQSQFDNQTITDLTNSRELILFPGLNDVNGLVHSGVRGIYLWNSVSQTRPGDATFITANEIPATGIQWTLAAGLDGDRYITMQTVDNAGNTSVSTYNIKLDTAPPGAPVQFQHAFGDNQLAFHWQGAIPDDDLLKFVVIYTPPFGIGTTTTDVTPIIINDTKTGGFNIQFTGYAANQPVTIEVYSVDQAGNSSATVSYTAYTPAALGELSFLGVDYDPATGHQLKWQIGSMPGQAQSNALEYGNMTSEGFAALGRVYADSNGLIIHNTLADGTKLQPHVTYHYRLVAFNHSGDSSYGVPFDQEVPNMAPDQPVALSPLQYARTATQFTYQPATDPDGDPLTYQIYLGKGTNPAAFDLLADGTAGNLSNGQTYTWYVTATDSYGEVTASDRVRFTVDGNAPELSAIESHRPYTNQDQLTISTGDDFSGIDKVSWQKIDAITNLQVETGTVELNGTLTGTIPLAQGNYHLQITAWDKAGNSKEIQVNNLMVDHTKPVFTSLNLKLAQSGSRYISGSTRIPVTFSANDDFSGLGAISYALVNNQNQPLANGTLIQLRPGFDNYSYLLEATAQPGQEYYLAAAILDAAGNCSDVKYYGPILFDLTAPVVDLTLEGFSKYGAASYLADVNNLNVILNAADPETNLIRTEVAITDANQTMVSDWGTWESIKQNTGLISGTKYRITVRAENAAGLIAQKWSPEFIYDNTPPEISNIQGPTGTVTSGEQVVIRINAGDQESGITEYRLAICLDAPIDYKLTSLIPGNQDGWINIRPGDNPQEIRLELPTGAGGNYYPIIQATNGAGLTTFQSGTKFTISNTAEKISVSDQGPYNMFTDRFSGAWKYLGTRQITGYRYRVVGQDQQNITDWQTTTTTEITITGLNLESGKIYRFEVQADYGDGSYTESGFSPGVTIDTTAPEISSLVTPECATSDNLRFQWAGNDFESGVRLVQAALGSDYYRTDITGGWVTITGNNSMLICDIHGNALQLETGKRYYLTLRLTNGAGLTTETINCGIIIDDTPPPVPVIFDQGAYINPKQPLQANWLWSPEDPESGPNSYQWTLIKDGRDLDTAVWQNGDATKRIQVTEAQIKELFPYLEAGLSPDGSTFYFAVRAINRAGLASTGVSNGIMADSTAPYIPEVKLLNAVNLGDPNAAEVNYITNNQNLGLWINSFDPETPIDQYLYAWGNPAVADTQTRKESEQSQIQLQDPSIHEGEITLFVGECSNKAELVSATGYSSGVVLDTGAPKITNVHGGVCGNRLLFDWDVISSISPVAFYEVALVKSKDANSIPATWTNTGLNRCITVDGTNLADDKYCLLIRATNEAGTVSRREETIDEWGTSPVVMLDRTPPVIGDFSYDKYASNQLTLHINASDNLAGINGYQYAIGSLADPFKYCNEWIDINSQAEDMAYTVNTSHIAHNSSVYLMIRTIDKAGLCSKPVISDKIIIDHTKPGIPVITCRQYNTSKTEIRGIQFTAQDPESGITHYRLGVVTQPGTQWLATQVRSINEFDGQFDGLNLTEAGVYFLAIQTQNGAGDWSDIGCSTPITVDTVVPEMKFVKAGSTVVTSQPPLEVEFTLSEDAHVQFSLITGNGISIPYSMNGNPGVNQFIFNESKPDTYTLTAQAIDPAGNVGPVGAEQTQLIRVNAPPQIALPAEINATPGQPLNFTATVVDPDGVPGDVLTYQWNPGDGNGTLTGTNPPYRYTKTGQYTLNLTVTDKDGSVTIVSTTVKIANTTRGSLYMDEVWSGEHHIYDDVTVPEGIHLTILPGTRVIIDGIPGDTGYNHALIIQGSLTVQSDTSFKSVNGTVDNGWKGIYITGQATLDGANIYHALRGITVMDTANVTINNCSFTDNYIGIHVYGSKPQIDHCQFTNNQWYGIKEDQGGRPVVTHCMFTGNEVNYYQDQVSEITLDDLNRIPGNGGNDYD